MSEDHVFAKCAWRLIPFMVVLLIVNYVDRLNVAFAALTMNRDLGFSPAVYGFGAGVFFLSYASLQIPANLILQRVGARRWFFCIMAAWGLVSASTALVRNPPEFYALRFLLGIAEAGFYPGMLLYLTYWFPRSRLGRFTAWFNVAIPLSAVIGGPLASFILRLDGAASMAGWQWLFLLEGLPALLLSCAVLSLLPDGPQQANWLSAEEKRSIAACVSGEEPDGRADLWFALRDPRLLALGIANFCFQTSIYGVGLFLPLISQAMGFTSFSTGFIVSACFLAGAVAMIVCGHSSAQRRERIWHVVLPWVFAAMSFTAAAVIVSAPLVLIALALGLMGIYGAFGAFFSLPSSFLRGAGLAGGIGLFGSFGNLGGFFGPVLFGALRQESGGYTLSMLTAALAMTFAAILVFAFGRATAPRSATEMVRA
jgi:ACS family tartrate transporter-like MFS transporter